MSKGIMRKVIQEIEDNKLVCRATLRETQEEHDFLVEVSKSRGCSINSYRRWLVKRRMYEYETNEGQLFEVQS